MNIGDRVRITNDSSAFNGQSGTIERISHPENPYLHVMLLVKLDDKGDGPGWLWCWLHELNPEMEAAA